MKRTEGEVRLGITFDECDLLYGKEGILFVSGHLINNFKDFKGDSIQERLNDLRGMVMALAKKYECMDVEFDRLMGNAHYQFGQVTWHRPVIQAKDNIEIACMWLEKACKIAEKEFIQMDERPPNGNNFIAIMSDGNIVDFSKVVVEERGDDVSFQFSEAKVVSWKYKNSQ